MLITQLKWETVGGTVAQRVVLLSHSSIAPSFILITVFVEFHMFFHILCPLGFPVSSYLQNMPVDGFG